MTEYDIRTKLRQLEDWDGDVLPTLILSLPFFPILPTSVDTTLNMVSFVFNDVRHKEIRVWKDGGVDYVVDDGKTYMRRNISSYTYNDIPELIEKFILEDKVLSIKDVLCASVPCISKITGLSDANVVRLTELYKEKQNDN